MTTYDLSSTLKLDDDFDPLAEDETTLDPDVVDDDDPNDIVDLPVIPNMPEGMVLPGIFNASSYEDPREAINNLFNKNPGRRPVYLDILALCAQGAASSHITEVVNEIQADNFSVYAPITLCRALERAGALTVDEAPAEDTSTPNETPEYLEITERIDPIWTTTDAGRDVLEHEREGHALTELFDADATYLIIYQRVLAFCAEGPRTKKEIDDIVDHDPLVQDPRRYSNHFIELLERGDALVWKEGTWNITDLGRRALTQLVSPEASNNTQ